jgi:phosphoribosylamine--glycine ligase
VRVLVVGGGGREHALVWRLSRDPAVTELLATPGNPGIAELAACHPAAIDDVAEMVNLIDGLRPDLVVVGPEVPLVAGLADVLEVRGVDVFGPTAAAARLEGSKAFAKDLLQRSAIPTARSGSFEDVEKAVAFVDELGGRAVVKADGLAAGKGVVVAEEREDAVTAIRACLLERAFGPAGSVVVVEELLQGPEVSAFALSDGERTVPLSLGRDHKRAGDGDTGPNTGGMGAYAPVAAVDAATEDAIWPMLERTVEAMAAEGTPYRGVLYAGLMLTADGPRVLEFNCRFGDPEAQVLLPRLASDPAALFQACAAGRLEEPRIRWRDGAAVTVVLASGGYPGSYRTGIPIHGLDAASAIEGVTVFHAGTARDADGTIVTAGGRVLDVTAVGASVAEARERAYRAAELIRFDGVRYRRDIAAGAAEEEGA